MIILLKMAIYTDPMIVLMREQYVISIGKRHDNYGKRYNKRNKHTHWFLYFYDKDGVFHNKRISWIQAMYWKTQKKYKLNECKTCNRLFIGVDQCPNCE